MDEIYITNSLTRKKEKFEAINPPKVGMYTCGMTVYDYAHIGHGRKYVGDDVLRRVLEYNGYQVNHVQNVTDVGHLVSDDDVGEDKLEKGARKFKKSVWEVAAYFTQHFYESMDKLNVLRPTTICKATEHIKEQIEMVKKLEERGMAYDTPEAVYFDVSKFNNYGKLFGQDIGEKRVAVREGVNTGKHKKNNTDFALWFKRVGRFKKHIMSWDSPWGSGFPGWHIECSAMGMKYLGEQFDIHTGGEDHLSVHHPNEIAQAEGSTGKSPFVRYWIHHAFLKVDGKKMSKSLGNLYTLEDVEKKGIKPLALRYLFLTAHYKDPLNFTWEGLDAASSALDKLYAHIHFFRNQKSRVVLSPEKRKKVDDYIDRFRKSINDDLNTPKAVAVLWEVVKSNVPSEDKYDLLIGFDEVLGLRMVEMSEKLGKLEVPEEVKKLVQKRNQMRKEGKYEEADRIRKEIQERGYLLRDTDDGTIVDPVDK